MRHDTFARRNHARQLLKLTVLCATLLLLPACRAPAKVELGMTTQQVVAIPGEPDRKAILEGKVLRDYETIGDKGLGGLRHVYFFDSEKLQVWFKTNAVTGIVRGGVSIK